MTPEKLRHQLDFIAQHPSQSSQTFVVDVCQAALERLDELEAEVRSLRERLKKFDALPKCWTLVDGELVQSRPVVPGMELYFGTEHVQTYMAMERLGETTEAAYSVSWPEWADSPEAAELLRERGE